MATPEQIEREAWRIWNTSAGVGSVVAVALRLSREGWEPVDEALLMAREVAASVQRGDRLVMGAAEIEAGKGDRYREVRACLAMHSAMIAAGYSKGREQERGA